MCLCQPEPQKAEPDKQCRNRMENARAPACAILNRQAQDQKQRQPHADQPAWAAFSAQPKLYARGHAAQRQHEQCVARPYIPVRQRQKPV